MATAAPEMLAYARAVASSVVDPELPMLTLADLGVLRAVELDDDGTVIVSITPTYSGCPAMATMRDDLTHRLQDSGFTRVRVQVTLQPAWTTDWITPAGRAALAHAGISPPGSAPRRDGPIALSLSPTRRNVRCPRCSSSDLELTSEFGSTACKALYRCRACLEPFDHVKEI
jgi:ring-1,2-phenylacetyl-CoA epoxidase subunit PaaD